jgi:hypothetical protein
MMKLGYILFAMLVSLKGYGLEGPSIEAQHFAHSHQIRERVKLRLGLQSSQMLVESSQLNGTGASLGGSAMISEKVSAHLLSTQAITKDQITGRFRSLYSGFLTGLSYAVFGKFGTIYDNYSHFGRPFIETKSSRSWNLSLGLCFDQYSLNGADAVYSASGLGYLLEAELPVSKNFWIMPQLRQSNLAVGSDGTVNSQTFLLFFQFDIE